MRLNAQNGVVVLIDDDRELRELLAEYLDEAGYEVHTFENGTGVIQFLQNAHSKLESSQQIRVDTVVSDYKLPDTNGFEILDFLASDFPHIPFIMMTSFGKPHLEKESKDKGAFGYIEKPFQLVDLNTILRNAIDSKKIA